MEAGEMLTNELLSNGADIAGFADLSALPSDVRLNMRKHPDRRRVYHLDHLRYI